MVYYSYIFFTLRILPFLSKLLIIFSHILSKLLPFIALQLALLYVFSFVFSSSMNSIPLYQTLSSSFDALVGAFFGNVEMSSDFFSKAMVVFFMLLNALIMVNMLIAVMLEDYALLSRNARPLYLRWLLSIEPFWSAHSSRGFLSFKWGPLLFLNLLLSPLLCFKSRRLN